MKSLNSNIKAQSSKLIIYGICILSSFIFVQNISAGVLTIEQTLTSGKIADKCISYFPVRLDTEGSNTNSADIKITFDPLKAKIRDFDLDRGGIQVQNGNVFAKLPYNFADNSLGEIKVSGYRMNSFVGNGLFFYVYVEPLQLNIPVDFTIEFTAANDTYDSNIAETSTSTDLLTSVQNRTFVFTQSLCDGEVPLPIPEEPPIDPGVEEPVPNEPETPISPPVKPPVVPDTPETPDIVDEQIVNPVEELIENIEVIIPLVFLGIGTLLPGIITGSPLDFILYFVGSFLIKRKYWGIVFDSATFNKLAFTTIRLYKLEGSKEVFLTQTISDIEGRYGFKIGLSGTYMIKFLRESYEVTVRTIVINKTADVILDVGMRPLGDIKLGAFALIRKFIRENFSNLFNILRIISVMIMLVGVYLMMNFFSQYPSLLSFVILLIYIALLFLQIYNILADFSRNKKIQVLDNDVQEGVKGVIVRFTNLADSKQREEIIMTDEKGKLNTKLQNAKYKYQATKAGYNIETGTLDSTSVKQFNPILISQVGKSTKKFGEL